MHEVTCIVVTSSVGTSQAIIAISYVTMLFLSLYTSKIDQIIVQPGVELKCPSTTIENILFCALNPMQTGRQGPILKL